MPMRREAFLGNVQERGEYQTLDEAERAARVVLALLGAHLVGTVRAELAARLPETYALILLNPLQAAEPLSRNVSSARRRPGSKAPPSRRPCGTSALSCPPWPRRRETSSCARSCSSSRPDTTSSSATPSPPDTGRKPKSSKRKATAAPCTTSLERTRPSRP